MSRLPTGTVTFLFTDIEGSTRLLQTCGDEYPLLIARHHELLREAVSVHGGVEVMTEGDSFFVVFRNPAAAVAAAVNAQRSIAAETWPANSDVRVRMGLHTGEAILGGDNYIGLDVHRAARIANAGHGGQVLISDATRALAGQGLPAGVSVRDLGEHRLKDLPAPERLYQLAIDGLPADFPPLRSLSARPNNLPRPATSFIGREQQIDEIKARLATARLVTLTGPGGTGKTRLSIRVAEDLLPDFEHGVWFVGLDALRDAELVPSTIAAALNVHVGGDQTAMSALVAHLRERELLLVLDNFEQVTDAARYIGELIVAAPGLSVLATSRVPLHLSGEVEYAVPPLAVVSELRNAADSAARLSQYEAVRLFIERAVAVKRDFAVTNDNAPAVAEICIRLDGLPLAIELAAARVKLLAPEQILARLHQSLSLLASAATDLPERQRTLQGAIDWSFGLLDEAEQRLFVRLAAFRGGMTLEAIEAVAGPGLSLDIFDGVASLVDKSLLRAVDDAAETRFAMLETIRTYADERLHAATDAGDVLRRHAEYFFDLALASEEHITADDQVAWLDRLEREHDNLRASLERAVDVGLVDRALTAAGAIWRFWQQRGHFAEARATYDRLLTLPATDPTARAKALTGAGGIAYWQGDYEAMTGFYREARELYEQVGDVSGAAEAWFNEAFVPTLERDFNTARPGFERAAALYRQAGDEEGAAGPDVMLAWIDWLSGRAEDAVKVMTHAVATYRQAGAQFQLADTLSGLAFTHASVGDWLAAKSSLLESVEIFASVGNEVGTIQALEGAAMSAIHLGDTANGVRLLGFVDATKARLGAGAPSMFINSDQQHAQALEVLGQTDFDRLHAEGAQLSTDEALALFRALAVPDDATPLPSPWAPATAASRASGRA
jgi:predicted ATPase/class 3 adenylate cyclase